MVKLLVDCETRNAIYHSVGEPGFTTRTTTRPPQPPTDLAATFEPMESYLTVRSPTTSAMVVIDGSVSDRVIATVRAAGQSKVKQSPTLVLTAAKVAEINDIMERPFATGFDPQHSQVKVENFEAGMRIRMLASPGDGFIRFVAEIISSRITSVGKAELPQYSAEPIVVQTPIQATQSVVVNANLPTGHSLLIDPHVTQTDSFEQEIAAPMFGKLPYVGKNFRDTETVQVDRHVLVLITPESSRQ
jgi:type II secretory pathway component GspD/PulD (secretin)